MTKMECPYCSGKSLDEVKERVTALEAQMRQVSDLFRKMRVSLE